MLFSIFYSPMTTLAATYPGSEVEVKDPIILEPTQPPAPVTPNIPLWEGIKFEVLSALSLAASAGVLYLSKNLKSKVEELKERMDKDDADILPPSEIERVKDILAQISILTDADRVTLGVFHNGVIGAKGAQYDKVAILAGYCSPGVMPLPELDKDVKAENLMEDLSLLWNKEGNKFIFLSRKDAPDSCSLYMSRRDISHLYNMILSVGNIEIAVLSLHWCSSVPESGAPIPPSDSRGDQRFKDLTRELVSIVQSSKDGERILG